MEALSVGLPGRLKSRVTPRMKAHRSRLFANEFRPVGEPDCLRAAETLG
jgi:hypothetical protein